MDLSGDVSRVTRLHRSEHMADSLGVVNTIMNTPSKPTLGRQSEFVQ